MTSSNGNIFRVTGHLSREFTGSGESPTQRPVTRSFDVFFDLRLNEWLSKQSWGWWFETPRIYASPGIRKLIVSSVKALCVNTPVILLWFGRQIIFWMNTHFTNEWWARNPNPKKMRVGITWQLLIRMRKLCHSFKTATQDRAMHHVVNRTGISALEQPVKWVGRSAKNGASTFDNCERACDNYMYITTRNVSGNHYILGTLDILRPVYAITMIADVLVHVFLPLSHRCILGPFSAPFSE